MRTFKQHLYQWLQAGWVQVDVGRVWAGHPEALDMMLSGINLGSDRRIVEVPKRSLE